MLDLIAFAVAREGVESMKRSMLTITSAVCAAGLIAIIVGSHTLSAQDEHADKGDKDKPPPVYNPYPPGILPPDLDSETARVLREIDVIEGRAIERWHSLPLPTRLEIRPGPNPPVLKDLSRWGWRRLPRRRRTRPANRRLGMRNSVVAECDEFRMPK